MWLGLVSATVLQERCAPSRRGAPLTPLTPLIMTAHCSERPLVLAILAALQPCSYAAMQPCSHAAVLEPLVELMCGPRCHCKDRGPGLRALSVCRDGVLVRRRTLSFIVHRLDACMQPLVVIDVVIIVIVVVVIDLLISRPHSTALLQSVEGRVTNPQL